MMSEVLWIIAVIAVANLITRFLPYFALKGRIPPTLQYIADMLPNAIIAMLVVYCLRDTEISAPFYGLRELAGVLSVAILHLIFKIPVLSILGGVFVYMLLVQNL